ncbi:Pollen Ole e 1 allergen and extensin family protein [Rhynchospora pubera]|uniref:Pollen Ole e 1 allergen and extensin family protein n=1 Tax=Rhynchospora pubera TaxID=906938 RepID=A0AAV8HVZ1_9POAL|nr:Pollen Ole e 1 allergen and extensin family protein [Rhynchospora pubera]
MEKHQTPLLLHGHRKFKAISMAVLLFLFLHLLGFAEAVADISITDENPLVRLSRAELSRIAGYGEEMLSSVLVIGTLDCGVCIAPGSRLLSVHVPGAKIAVACKTEGETKKTNWTYGTTDEYGEFMIDLPSKLHATPNLEESCVVRILKVPSTSHCKIRTLLNSHHIKLASVGNGIRVYTAGTIQMSSKSRPSHRCTKMDNASLQLEEAL